MPVEPALAVADGIEDRGVGLARVEQRRLRIEQALHAVGEPLDQRHLDEDQRLARHARMEEGVAAAIGIEPVLQVAPGADVVHRLVADELLQQRRRTVPVDAAEFEEADIEPARQQRLQIALQRGEHRVALPAACSSEARRSTRNFIPSGIVVNCVSRRRRGGSSARRNCALAAVRAAMSAAARTVSQGGGDGVGVGIEAGEGDEEVAAPGLVEGQVGLGQLGRAVAGAHLAAASGEAGAHLAGDALVLLDGPRRAPCRARHRGDPAQRTVEQPVGAATSPMAA